MGRGQDSPMTLHRDSLVNPAVIRQVAGAAVTAETMRTVPGRACR